MKHLILIPIFAFCSNALAAEKTNTEAFQSCFVTDRCIDTVKACQIDPSEYNQSVGYARIRVNTRYGCPTSSGVQYVWEQGNVKSYAATDFHGDSAADQASALKLCQQRLANLISEEGACSK